MDLKLSLKGTAAEEEAISRQENVEEEPTTLLQKLVNEEANLAEERKNLHVLLASLRARKEKLQLKLQEEIARKKKSIRKLRSEIRNLKFSCDELI